MKTITKLGYAFGVLICILSTIQWWVMFYDPSQFAIGFAIGIIVLGFAYIYEWMHLTESYTENLTKRLDSLVYGKKVD